MRRRWLGGSALAISLLISGCATLYHIRPGTLEASRAGVAPEQRVAVWRRAVGVLLDQGYVPQVLNETACFIKATRREDIADDAFAGTMALVSISPEGEVRVEVTGVGIFHTERQFINAVGQRQRMLLDLILDRTGGAGPARSG